MHIKNLLTLFVYTFGLIVLCSAPASAYSLHPFSVTGSYPNAITIDPAGNLYTANYSSNTVTKITPAGVSTTLGTTGFGPSAITIDPAGNIYTTNLNDNNVTKITNPILTEVTPVLTPNTDLTPSYTFGALVGLPTTITYGGSCTSITTSASFGSNTITFSMLPPGTYTDCTIAVTDAFGVSNTLSVTSFTISACTPTAEICGDSVDQDCNGSDLDCCTPPICGDGVTTSPEECDDSNVVSNDGCSLTCIIEFCGDSVVKNGLETCDDGNNVSEDGCSSTCKTESCGDGIK